MDPPCAQDTATVSAKPAPGVCSKCKAAPGQFPIRGDLLCSACFLVSTEHRFKSTLRTQVPFQRGEKLLVAVSGGASSMSLLHMVAHALDPQRNKRHMNFSAEVLCVDVTAAYVGAEDSRELIRHLEKYGIPVAVVRVEDGREREIEAVRTHQDECGAEYLYFLVRKTIVEYAERNGISKVLVGESGSRIAGRVLSWICKGRGAALYNESGYVMPIGEVSICRPLRDVLDSELALYTHLESLAVFPRLPLSHNFDLPGFGSVDLLTQTFLHTLQEKFPATTHTVLRTASKLTKKGELPQCRVCLGPQDAPLTRLEGDAEELYCYSCALMVGRVRGSPGS